MNTSTLISPCQLTDAEAALNSDLTAWLARGEASVYDAEGDCLGDAKTPADVLRLTGLTLDGEDEPPTVSPVLDKDAITLVYEYHHEHNGEVYDDELVIAFTLFRN